MAILPPLRTYRRYSAVLLAVALLGASSPASAAGALMAAQADAAGTVWLCRPGLANDPCTASLSTTVVQANGSTTVTQGILASNPPADCFYVYPTVSTQRRINATLEVEAAETGVATAQASRFSQVCRVWAPMYQQVTVFGLAFSRGGSGQATEVAYQSVLAGWQDYLAHYNNGRPIIFIGHSQGASLLIRLLQSQVDANATLRHRLVSAILLGGNVTVSTSSKTGGSFQNIPACHTLKQIGCVIAYSSFPSQPPTRSLFGRLGQGVSALSGQTATTGAEVLCVNPAALGGTAQLDSYFPTSYMGAAGKSVKTPWIEYPHLYTATCKQGGGASWLNVIGNGTQDDTRPLMKETLGPTWGYHLVDVNVALGNLVNDVRQQEAFYQQPATSK